MQQITHLENQHSTITSTTENDSTLATQHEHVLSQTSVHVDKPNNDTENIMEHLIDTVSIDTIPAPVTNSSDMPARRVKPTTDDQLNTDHLNRDEIATQAMEIAISNIDKAMDYVRKMMPYEFLLNSTK